MKPDDVDLESHVGIELGELDDRVRARLAEFVATREQRLVELRERALDAEQEARVLRRRVESLQEQVEALEDEMSETAGSGPDLDTESLVATFGDALSSERISRSGFTVSDLSVDLRAKVVNTDEGLRVALPDPNRRPAPDSLSELRFSVRSDPEAGEPELDEVPDLIGITEDGAREMLQTAGFDVGAVDTVPADAEPGRVVDQLPSPYSLAEPGAPVDLEVADASDETVNLVGETFADVVRFAGDRFSLQEITAVASPDPPGTVIAQDPAPGEVGEGDRLSVTISAYPEPNQGDDLEASGSHAAESSESAENESEPTNDRGTGTSVAEGLLAAATEAAPDEADPLVERNVEEIHGIGDTYGRRLRDVGIESLADLAVAEPVRVADAANVPDDRAQEWIDAVLDIARDMAGEERTGEGR